MSNFITTAFVNQFSDNVMLLSQQKMSKLRGAVRVEAFNGEKAFFEQLAPTYMQKRSARHGDTPLIETDHKRRMVIAETFDWADLIDKPDVARTLPDFTNPYLINAAAAAGRQMDDLIVDAIEGTAKTGQDGTTNTSYDSGMTVAKTIGPVTGLNVAKLIAAKAKLDAKDVDPSIPRYIAPNAIQMGHLLNDPKATSADYAAIKALVQGDIDTFLGFKFIMCNRIKTVSSANRIPFWAQDGLLLGVNYDVMARVSERDDKNYSVQAFLSMQMGATRMEEAKVGVIDADVTSSNN